MPVSLRSILGRRGFLPFAACLLIASAAWAADPEPVDALLSEPVFTAQRLDGTTVEGRIRRIDPNAGVVLVPAKGAEVAIPLRRLLKLSRDHVGAGPSPEGSIVLFPGGDQVCRTSITSANERSLEVQSETLGNLSIPLDSLLGLVLAPPTESDELDALLLRVRHEARKSEVLWLANGDRIAGSFQGLDERKVKFQGEGAPMDLDRAGVVALGFDPALVSYPRPEADYVEATLLDGSRLGVQAPRVERGQLIGTTRFGQELRLPIGEVTAIHARTPAVSYLSEQEVSAKQYVAYLGPTRPYRRDATVDGHPFRLSGRTYERGLGTQSRTLLAYRLGPSDRRFQAVVGLDDRAGPLGSVVFRVLVDGKQRYASPPLSVRDQPRNLDVDVSGGKVLILTTEFGERGDVRDYADWIEARLIR